MHAIVRFAPSPTGRIHIGNARTALLNFLFAKKNRGQFILRFDDTDVLRSKEEYAQAIEVDLEWLGIIPDLTFRQSDRFTLYNAAAAKLREAGRLYPCYETAEELERKRKRQQARGEPPVYDRAALRLASAERARFESEGRRPHWRFKLDHETICWNDLVRGECHIDCASLSDPVLVREDGTYLYTLPSVVDDAAQHVSHIIRGEDHVTNTAVQLQLFRLLAGLERLPLFGHHNLLASVTGEALSKRTGSSSIAVLRDAGIESLAVAAAAVLTGSSKSLHAIGSLGELMVALNLAELSRSVARFDTTELAALSVRTLHLLNYEAVRERLAAHDIIGYKAPAFWLAVRGNLTKFLDAATWWRVVQGEITPVVEDADFLDAARQHLPEEPWGDDIWANWTATLKRITGRKGRMLFHPLRLALTGSENGPELAALLPLIGRTKVAARLSGRAA
ncbi:MAG TPA: glutamate--tRNA ligase [Methylocella sp.]|nr:glutamate--tRNA ligase [Methylocella sp.]